MFGRSPAGIKSISAINRELSNLNSNIKTDVVRVEDIPDRNNYTGRYNCWGFTARMFGWIKTFRWIEDPAMERLMKKHSVPVDEPQVGDIAVFRSDYGFLHHTALVTFVGKKTVRVVHKPGGYNLEVISVAKIIREFKWYHYGPHVTYRRPVFVDNRPKGN